MDMMNSDEQELLSSDSYPDDSDFGLENMLVPTSSFASPFSGPAHTLTRSVSLDETLLYPSSNLFKTPPNGTGFQSSLGSPTDPAKVQFSFPNKLFNMLESSDESIIGWLANGKGFRVYDVETFTSQLLPKFFNHSKFESFQRQLNIYGFKRVLKGTLVGAYFNPNFQRNLPDLLGNIKRTVASRSRSMGSIDGGSQTGAEPVPGAPGKRKRRQSTANPTSADLEDDVQLWSASLDTGMDDLMAEPNMMFPPFPFISKSDANHSNVLSNMDNTSLIASLGDSDFHKASGMPKLSLALPSALSKEIKSVPTKKQQKAMSQLQKTMAQYSHLSSAFVSPRDMSGTASSPAASTPAKAVSSDSNGLTEHDSPLSHDFNGSSVICMADVATPSIGGGASPTKSPRGRPPRIRKPKLFDDANFSPSSSELVSHGFRRPVPLTPGGRSVLEEDLTEISIDPFVLAQYGEIYYMPPEGGKAIRIKANYISDHSSRVPLRSVSSEHGAESSSTKRSSPVKKTPNSVIENKMSSTMMDDTHDQGSQRTDPDLLHNLAMGIYGHDHHSDLHADLQMDLHEYPLAPTPLPGVGDMNMSHSHEIPFETIFADPASCFSH